MEIESLAAVIRKILLEADRPLLNHQICERVFARTGEQTAYTSVRTACHILRVRNEDPDRTLLSDVKKGYWYSSDDAEEVPRAIQQMDERLNKIQQARDAMHRNWMRRLENTDRYERAKILEQWEHLT